VVDPAELAAAVQAAFVIGGVTACEAMREDPRTTRRVVEVVTGALSRGWEVVGISVISEADYPEIKRDPAVRSQRRRNPTAAASGVGCLALRGRRDETDQELRARVGYGATSVDRGLHTIWGSVNWGWAYPSTLAATFSSVVRYFAEAVKQVLTEDHAVASLSMQGRTGLIGPRQRWMVQGD
jgi:hypothetical protein